MIDPNPLTKEFMLTYYPSIYQRYLYEREVLDKRLNAFLTLASAIIGGVLLLANQASTLNVYVIVLVGLAIALVIGFVTYERVCTRSVTAIRWLMRANLALKYFTENDNRLIRYVRPHRINELSQTWLQSIRLGGLAVARTIAILNVISACGITTILTNFLYHFDTPTMITVNIAVVLLTWLLQVMIWRTKLHKLQTIVAPSFNESAPEESYSLVPNTNLTTSRTMSTQHNSQKKSVVVKNAKAN